MAPHPVSKTEVPLKRQSFDAITFRQKVSNYMPNITSLTETYVKQILCESDPLDDPNFPYDDFKAQMKSHIAAGGGGPVGRIMVILPTAVDTKQIRQIQQAFLAAIKSYTGQEGYATMKVHSPKVIIFDNVTLYGDGHNIEGDHRMADAIKQFVDEVGVKSQIYFQFYDYKSWTDFQEKNPESA